jgi:serine/threonine protein kinase
MTVGTDCFRAGGRHVVASLTHPAIVIVHWAFVAEGHWCVVMEQLNGTVLRDKIGTLEVSDRLDVLRRILLALDYAHKKGVVHGDLHAGNVILENHPRSSETAWEMPLKLIDFGTSVFAGRRRAEQGSRREASKFLELTRRLLPEARHLPFLNLGMLQLDHVAARHASWTFLGLSRAWSELEGAVARPPDDDEYTRRGALWRVAEH